jgi:hypothetical protein
MLLSTGNRKDHSAKANEGNYPKEALVKTPWIDNSVMELVKSLREQE